MSKQKVKSFSALVFGFLIGISAAEIYHMETQSAQDEACNDVASVRELVTPALEPHKVSDLNFQPLKSQQ